MLLLKCDATFLNKLIFSTLGGDSILMPFLPFSLFHIHHFLKKTICASLRRQKHSVLKFINVTL